jgi:DNA-binding NarL/FixJ family response regulator
VRVVVAEDTMLTREGIVRLLGEAGVEVVGVAEDGNSLLREVAMCKPDAVLVDIRMPPTHSDEGLVAANQIRAQFPGVAVLLLSHYVEPDYALRLLAEHPGGVGYLLKERVFDVAVILDALRRLVEGENVVDPTIVARVLGRPRADDPLRRLTDREGAVLALLAEGLTNHAIAARLFVTDRTVETHVTQIFAKLGLRDATDAHRRVLAVLAYLRA